MSLIVALQDRLTELSPQETKLCQYILDHTRETTQMSITHLAQESGCSTSTISRFCRLFHVDTFSELKLS